MSNPEQQIPYTDSSEWRRSLENSLKNEISNCSRSDRITYVRSMTDRLQLSIDDIRGTSSSNKLNALNSIPQDLLPFEINLVDGRKILLIGINPVCTCFEDKIDNLQGDIIHLYVRKKGEELPSDFLPPKKMFHVPPPPVGFVRSPSIKLFEIPTVDKDYEPPKPSTSKEGNLQRSVDTKCNNEYNVTENSSNLTINSELEMNQKSYSSLESSSRETVLRSNSTKENVFPSKQETEQNLESSFKETVLCPNSTIKSSSPSQNVSKEETECNLESSIKETVLCSNSTNKSCSASKDVPKKETECNFESSIKETLLCSKSTKKQISPSKNVSIKETEHNLESSNKETVLCSKSNKKSISPSKNVSIKETEHNLESSIKETVLCSKFTKKSISPSKNVSKKEAECNLESSVKETVLCSKPTKESTPPSKNVSKKETELSSDEEINTSSYVTSDFSSKFQVVGLIETKCVDESSSDISGYKKYTRKQTPTALILIQKDEEDIVPTHKMDTRSKTQPKKIVQGSSSTKKPSLRSNTKSQVQGKKSPVKDSKSPILSKKPRTSIQCSPLRSSIKRLNSKDKRTPSISPSKKRQNSKSPSKITKIFTTSP